MDHSNLIKQIKKSKEAVKRMKKTNPELFPEWQELQAAKDHYMAAKHNYELILRSWENGL